ncbi:MAG: AbrB family transcriptional regulator, partial [Proteobacteria bacterium]|nr:AbrB family transcriptional regulator [Pseudomonadota bacterium]
WQMFPGTTAIWGTSPGASTAMIMMAEAYGGDPRLVAVMQQLRIVSVIGIAALVARMSGLHPQSSMPAIDWLGSNHWLAMLGTLAIALSGALIAPRIGMPAGSILVPMAASMVLNSSGLMRIELPGWLLALSYAGIGWSVGLRFTRPIIAYAFLALPRILISTFTLIAICCVIAAVLVVVGGIDPLTAYLATSPGGADSIAIIAASSTADLQFVMAMQTSRLIVAMFVSPGLSRYVTRQAKHFVEAPDDLPGR